VINFHYDALNSFGRLSVAGNFPNVINLGDAGIERMTVDVKLPEGGFTGSVTLTVQGSDNEAAGFTTIVQSGAVNADMIKDGYGLAIPKGYPKTYKFIRVTAAGAFSGTVEALINSYMGK